MGQPVSDIHSHPAAKSDTFVAKLDNTGNFIWAVKGGGVSEDVGFDIAVDSLGNTFLTGYFYGTTFGSHTLIQLVMVIPLSPS